MSVLREERIEVGSDPAGSRTPAQYPGPAGYDLSLLLEAEAKLSSCDRVDELFRTASVVARGWVNCARALVITVQANALHGGGLGALGHAESDFLRRRLLAEPIPLVTTSAEAAFIRAVESGRPVRSDAPSLLQKHLGLENFVFGAIKPEDHVLALLVLDGLPHAVGPHDQKMSQLFARMIAVRVENLFLRRRMNEFALELRYLTASAQALVKEGLQSPVALPSDEDGSLVFPMSAVAVDDSADALRELFTPRELSIIREVAAGRSNREIAQELHISHETVKKYVSRVMDKMGAANRADAAVRYLRMAAGR